MSSAHGRGVSSLECQLSMQEVRLRLTSILPGIQDGQSGSKAAQQHVEREHKQEEHSDQILVPCKHGQASGLQVHPADECGNG